MIRFLQSEESLKLYSNYFDLLAISNMYNITIDVFTYDRSGDSWRQISPDPYFKQPLNAISLPGMSLYHVSKNQDEI